MQGIMHIHERLPEEIISGIFQSLCTPGDDNPLRGRRSIELVCKRWRSILLNTPRAWSCMYLNSNSGSGGRNFDCVGGDVLGWIGRSRCAPFELHIQGTRDEELAKWITAVATAILPSLRGRLRTLSLREMDSASLLELDPLLSDLPVLTGLYLYSPGYRNSQPDRRLKGFSHCPRLRTFHISNAHVYCAQQVPLYNQASLPQLKKLTFYDSLPPRDLHWILSQCTQLLHADLRLFNHFSINNDHAIALPRIRCPRLRKLDIHISGIPHKQHILDICLLPALEDLHCWASGLWQTGVPSSNVILNLYRAEPFALKRLSINACREIDTAPILEILGQLWTIEELALDSTSSLSLVEIVDALVVHKNMSPRLPHLVKVSMCAYASRSEGDKQAGIMPEKICRFLESRWKPNQSCSRLRAFRFERKGQAYRQVSLSIDAEWSGRLKALGSEGMDLIHPWLDTHSIKR